jgi:hypothetical protein
MRRRSSAPGRRTASALSLLVLVVAGVIGGARAAEAEVTVEAVLDRQSIAMGERAILTVTVSGTSRAGEPELPALDDFMVLSAGSQRVVNIVNFKTTTSTIFTYQLVPRRTGSFEIPPIAVEVDQERLTTHPLSLTVTDADPRSQQSPPQLRPRAGASPGSGDERPVLIDAEATPDRVYIGEQVDLVIRFRHKVRVDELYLERPSLTGFWVEAPDEVKTYVTDIGGQRYGVAEWRFVLFPTDAGRLTIGSARADFRLRLRGDPLRDPFSLFDAFGRTERRSVETDPISITVSDLPRSGRPGSWNGAVGRYTIEATLDKQEVAVGDAATLSVAIRGLGNTRSVGDPELPEVEGLRSYMAETTVDEYTEGDRLGGVRTLRKAFIPEAPGTYTLPAIEYAYFDPATGTYREIRTRPLELRVTPGDGDPGTGGPVTGRGPALEDVPPSLSFIRLGDPRLGQRFEPLHRSRTFWALQLVPLVCLATGLALGRHVDRLRVDQGYARLARSGRLAARRLREAQRLQDGGSADAFFGALQAVLTGYVADRANLAAPGMTLDGATRLLGERGVDRELVDRFRRCVEQCEFGRFAPAAAGAPDRQVLLDEATAILRELERRRL